MSQVETLLRDSCFLLWCLVLGSVTALSGPPLALADGPDVLVARSSADAFDREVKGARAYIEAWFGAPMVLPPIEIVRRDPDDPTVDFPGHYRDGLIQIRPETLKKASELRRVLRHELTHAVIDQRTRGNCPQWLQEGIAQFLDGTDVVATEGLLRSDAAPLTPLFRMEGPFLDRDSHSREQAYRESASAVSFLVSRIARSGLLFIIQRLGEGRPFDRALLEAGLSYTELQQAWESSLRLPSKDK
jgi:hypothetical protein